MRPLLKLWQKIGEKKEIGHKLIFLRKKNFRHCVTVWFNWKIEREKPLAFFHSINLSNEERKLKWNCAFYFYFHFIEVCDQIKLCLCEGKKKQTSGLRPKCLSRAKGREFESRPPWENRLIRSLFWFQLRPDN